MNDENEPIFEVAPLAHVETLTPKPEETLWFFQKLPGLSQTTSHGQSVCLRAYKDFYHQTPRSPRPNSENRPQRPSARGVPVRRIDQVNLFASNVAPNRQFMEAVLDFRLRESKVDESLRGCRPS